MSALNNRIQAFSQLGDFLSQFTGLANAGIGMTVPERLNELFFEKFDTAIRSSHIYNGWFTEGYVRNALEAIALNLSVEKLESWLQPYDLQKVKTPRRIGVIMAGNIPLAGFHDFMTVLLSGHVFVGKLSSQDKLLLPAIAEVLIELEPSFSEMIVFTDGRIKDIEAVIATGSNNSSRYFDYYFGKYPNIIRRNRNSIAVITGTETEAELHDLGYDIFMYFGLGCRSVSKIFFPQDFKMDRIFNAIFDFQQVINNHKYANNYQYNKTVFMLNNEQLLDNGFVILKEDKRNASPVGAIYYERYEKLEDLEEQLKSGLLTDLQCIVAKDISSVPAIPFGKAQFPDLSDYADGVDTMEFLLGLS